MGHIIPAGTGLKKYKNLKLSSELEPVVEVKEQEIKVEEPGVE